MAIQSRTICQMSLIVANLDATLENYCKVFNFPKPKVFSLPKPENVPGFMDGVQGDYSDCHMAVLQFDNLVVEITQPGEGDSPWKRWLDAHGQGVQHIGFLVDEADKDEVFQSLDKLECSVYHAGFYPDLTYTFVNGFAAFGLDFNIKWHTDNKAKIADFIANPGKPLEKL